MKRAIFILGIVFAYACTKTDAPAVTPAPPVVQEESVKFSTNLDTGTLNFTDTIPLVITVNSKVPAAGFQYAVTTTWTDSSKQIFKIDTAVNANTLSFNLPGHTRMGNYSIAVSVTSKSTSSNTSSKTISAVNIPYLPAVNIDMFPDINWNDFAQNKNNYYDFNGDGTPDIISYKRISNTSVLPPIFYINDYTGKTLYSFNLKEFNSKTRDSLNNIIYDFRDLNSDGKLDLVLTYMGEWWIGNGNNPTTGATGRWYGINTFLLINKGNMQFETIEIINDPTNVQFNVNLFDWDFDGKVDILTSTMQDGFYYKNMGNNKFEKKTITPLFQQAMNFRGVDFNGDGIDDYYNLYVNETDENGNYKSTNMSQTLSVVTNKGVTSYPIVGKTITKSVYVTPGTTTAERMNMVDGDGDGDVDLIVGYIFNDNGLFTHFQEYFENNGSQFVYKPNYIEYDKTLYSELQVWSTDIDKDGLKDLYYPTYSKSRIGGPRSTPFWWKNTKQGFKIMKSYRFKY